ncbi:chimeric ERCC6-PGBD3 protein [Trichonephila inaurata madagascariensis]|uniref:Chimeric ERCC6-PGBD3 protein n=1 Tax=Trichonephila inaurata madagascariensis TaxID=2747483 RepID=A0A8X6XN24_9ARAC|nr:chimeric ERCC6-PGBD3 protein [Trichonephila inaurata madagascariensis]
MTCDRFETILLNLHVADNSNLDPLDKFTKLQPLINKLNEQRMKFVPNESYFGTDEFMVPYFERHGCQLFIRRKPIHFDYKFGSVGHQATGKGRKDCIDNPPLESDVILKNKKTGSFDYQIDGNGNIVCRGQDNNVVTVASSAAGVNPLSCRSLFSSTEKENFSPAAEHDKSIQLVYRRRRWS